ncbi:MAG: hypothetical protein AAF383_06530 [Cyanobacteria bacterium P01_A01_bin.83]
MTSKPESQLTPANKVFLDNSDCIREAVANTLKDVLGKLFEENKICEVDIKDLKLKGLNFDFNQDTIDSDPPIACECCTNGTYCCGVSCCASQI